jgi:hypothetical protein
VCRSFVQTLMRQRLSPRSSGEFIHSNFAKSILGIFLLVIIVPLFDEELHQYLPFHTLKISLEISWQRALSISVGTLKTMIMRFFLSFLLSLVFLSELIKSSRCHQVMSWMRGNSFNANERKRKKTYPPHRFESYCHRGNLLFNYR